MANKGWVLVQHRTKTFVWRGGRNYLVTLPQIGYILGDEELPPRIKVRPNHVVVLVASYWADDNHCLTIQQWHEDECYPLVIDDFLPMQRPGKFRQSHLSKTLQQEEES